MPVSRGSAVLVLMTMVVASHGVARAQRADPVVYKLRDELRISLRRAVRPPVIDGRLDDDVWKAAVPLRGFVQYEPVDSVQPPQPSEGYVSYDDDYLYVGFRAHESDAGDVRATVHPRERGGELDDKIAVALDTYNDNRRAYVFCVSPIGIQFDGVKTEGSNTDDTHDFVWRSAGRIDRQGWAAELAIPFASLRLPGIPWSSGSTSCGTTARRASAVRGRRAGGEIPVTSASRGR